MPDGRAHTGRDALHLLALQRALYDRLGLGAEFRLVAAADSAAEPDVLGRAHAIVDDEGAAAFVRELQEAAQRGPRR